MLRKDKRSMRKGPFSFEGSVPSYALPPSRVLLRVWKRNEKKRKETKRNEKKRKETKRNERVSLQNQRPLEKKRKGANLFLSPVRAAAPFLLRERKKKQDP